MGKRPAVYDDEGCMRSIGEIAEYPVAGVCFFLVGKGNGPLYHRSLDECGHFLADDCQSKGRMLAGPNSYYGQIL